MEHSLSLAGFGVCVRPIRRTDASDILELRNDSRLNRFIGDTSTDVSAQLEWLDRYRDRAGDYYFGAESLKLPGRLLGTLAIYDLDETARAAEWGRWLFRPDTLAATTSVLLMYTLAFETLSLDSLYCRTVADNQPVLGFHDQCGLVRERVDHAAVTIASQPKDLVVHRLRVQAWPRVKAHLERYAAKIERLV